MRFGIDSPGDKTLQEVGDKLGLTRERIRQQAHGTDVFVAPRRKFYSQG